MFSSSSMQIADNQFCYSEKDGQGLSLQYVGFDVLLLPADLLVFVCGVCFDMWCFSVCFDLP